MILIFKYIFPRRFVGLTLWPVIILKENQLKADPVLVNHERIHLRQQRELLILPFYIWYLLEWVIGIFRYRNVQEAYRNISFEREAYANEINLQYLDSRRYAAFCKYLF